MLSDRKSQRANLNVTVKADTKRKHSTNKIEEEGKYKKVAEPNAPERFRKIPDLPIPRMENRLPKDTPITDDYEISNHVLGLGINGKVVQCYDRKTREKFALKVIHLTLIIMMMINLFWQIVTLYR